MQIDFEISEREFVKASTQFARSRGFQIVSGAILSLVLACWAIYFIAVDSWAFGIVFLVLASLIPFYRRWLLARNASRTFRAAKFIHGPMRAEIDENGTRMYYSSGNSDTKWDGYTAWTETEAMFVLFLSDQFIRMSPKRAMSEGQLVAFPSLLQGKLSQR